MECIPAIDLRGGQAVRLLKGDFAEETGYGDPVALAARFARAGARRLHVVDLDAARGTGSNRSLIEAIVDEAGIAVELGGGIRSAQTAEIYLGRGVERLVLGTAGVERPELVRELAQAFPGRILLGLDHRRVVAAGVERLELALRGWLVGSGLDLFEVLARVADLPLGGLIVTDIGRDGTLAGPDLEGLRRVLEATSLPIIASGGVGSSTDLVALAALGGKGRRLDGAIVGKALVAGALSIEEALAACAA